MDYKLVIDVMTMVAWIAAAGMFTWSVVLGHRTIKAQMRAHMAQNAFNMLTMQRQHALESALLAKGVLTHVELVEALRDAEKAPEDVMQRSHLH